MAIEPAIRAVCVEMGAIKSIPIEGRLRIFLHPNLAIDGVVCEDKGVVDEGLKPCPLLGEELVAGDAI
ncbi:hypothetical protein OFM21_32170, partial [Escherichia coli]|nr:hypothetical protein [Escherichia coli]